MNDVAPTPILLAATTPAFAIALWLGLYLIARNPAKPLLRRAGLGLLAYALALACGLLGVGWLQTLLVFLPALSWAGATLLLLPEESPLRARLDAAWRWGLAPLGGLALLGAALAGLFERPGGPAYLAMSALVLLPLLGVLALVIRERLALRPAPVAGMAGAATLFFLLGAALLLFPVAGLSPALVGIGLGFDLALLGVAVAIFDAFDEGESLRLDMLRSLTAAGAAAALFGGQVALSMAAAGVSLPLVALLLGSVATAIVVQVTNTWLQALLDRLAFVGAPQIQRERAELRASAEALPRRAPDPDLLALAPDEFARLTRRALSHYGDLPRLASSPLTDLPLVTARLAVCGAPGQPLERAAELKLLLTESIARLRPRGDAAFGSSDEWRHYNALYFPYVVGLRPYSRRADHSDLDPPARQALEWLATQVPERTLYNWQNAAARLVAEDLRSQCS